MKKNYRLFIACGLLLAATAVQAQLYTLKNFSSATTLQAAEAPYGISVTAINAEIHTLSASLACLNINGNTEALKLVKTGTPAYSYIDITAANPETFAIEKVEVIGSSSGVAESFAVMAVSLDGTTFPVGPNAFHYTSSDMGYAMTRMVAFGTDPSMACTSIVTYLIPETAYQGVPNNNNRTPVANFHKQVKLIRLQWGAALASVGPSNTSWPPYIYGIKVYVKSSATGISVEKVEKTPVSSVYYNLTGRIVSETAKGFVIKKTIYSDGSVANEKVYNY